MSKTLRILFVCLSLLLLICTPIQADKGADLISEGFMAAKGNPFLLLSDSGIDVTVGRRSKTTLLIGGIGLATSYAATVVVGLAIEDSWGGVGSSYYLIPVIGPFLQIPQTSSPYTALCVISGVAQTGFLAVLLYGLIKKKKPKNDSSLQIGLAPIVSKNTNGIIVRIRF